MKILILSSNNGGGHNSVAKAVQECCEEHGHICQIRDCLSFISDGVSEVIAKSHNFMYRHVPELFDSSYRRSEQNTELFKEKHSARRMIDLGKYNLGQFLQAERFELVICTHVFGAMMLTAAKNHYDLSVRTAIIETDYANTPGCADNDMDMHFIPDASLMPELIAAGVDESRIVVSGIPVRRAILKRTERSQAKRQVGLDPEHRHILIMGGSMGCGPIPDILSSLHRCVDHNTQISVVCGTNERMLTELKESCKYSDNIHIYGYEPQISLLMDSADLLLTKPGGVSTTEAAAKALPMVLVNAVAGCEGHNMRFFLEKGGAVTADTAEGICRCCAELLDDEQQRRKMSDALAALATGDAAETVYNTLSELLARSTNAGENAMLILPVTEKPLIPKVQSSLRHGILEMPRTIYEASGILVNGRRIKSLVFTTDLAIIRNCDADAVFAVYPFTPQQAISDAIIKAAYIPVFCGVGGGTTKGLRTIGLAKDVESQGAMGVVLNAPITDLNLAAVARAVDIPVIITVVSMDTDVERRLISGASILNVAGGAQTPEIVKKIRQSHPEVPIIASGGNTEESIHRTIQAGANAITYTPPTTQDLFKVTMAKYREL